VRIEAGRDRSIAVANYYNKDPKKNNKIVIATQIDSLIEVPSLKDIYKIGALCEIVNVEPYSGANQEVYYVEVMPLKRVEILDLLTDKEYYEAKVEPAKETGASSPLNKKLIEELETVVRETKQKINFTIKADEENASKTADLIGGAFSEDDLQRNKLNRHAILSELNITRRLRLVIRNLRLNSLGDEVKRDIDQTINKKVNDNLSNQQKEFYLREKIRAVKDELGKLNPNENDLSGFKKKLEENPYPDNIRIKVTAEIQKIETNGFSQENAISKSYIE
jgi:ATP-dependent Lon protease